MKDLKRIISILEDIRDLMVSGNIDNTNPSPTGKELLKKWEDKVDKEVMGEEPGTYGNGEYVSIEGYVFHKNATAKEVFDFLKTVKISNQTSA